MYPLGLRKERIELRGDWKANLHLVRKLKDKFKACQIHAKASNTILSFCLVGAIVLSTVGIPRDGEQDNFRSAFYACS